MTAARAAVHVVNIKPSTASKAVCSAAFIHIEKGLFCAQNSRFGGFPAANGHCVIIIQTSEIPDI